MVLQIKIVVVLLSTSKYAKKTIVKIKASGVHSPPLRKTDSSANS